MPFFTLQVKAQGPMLSALVSVSGARRAALVDMGQPVPETVPIRALVDTGASGTCVDPSGLNALSLTPTGAVQVATPSTGSAPHTFDQYDVAIVVPGGSPNHAPLYVENIPVLSAELLQHQGFHALIGRDVLSLCLLSYDGMVNLFTLAY